MMAAQAQKQKNLFELGLPKPTTDVLSATYMTKLTGAILSHIVYARNLFNEGDFVDRQLGGQTVKIVNSSAGGSDGARCLEKWLTGAFDAIEKKYLKSLTLEIVDQRGCVQESYTFSYTYSGTSNVTLTVESEKDGRMDVIKKDMGNLEESVKNMIRSILVMTSTLRLLPLNCTTSVKISYYDDVTPPDYEPPNFKAFHPSQPIQEDHLAKILCGEVKTPFHGLTVKTKYRRFEQEYEAAVSCQCELSDTSGSMMKCNVCGTLQHSACYKVLSEEEASQKDHTCIKCSGDDNKPEDFLPAECIYRRLLAVCVNAKSITITKVIRAIQIPDDIAIFNLKRLQRENFIGKSAQNFSVEKPDYAYSIVKTKLQMLKSQYFSN